MKIRCSSAAHWRALSHSKSCECFYPWGRRTAGGHSAPPSLWRAAAPPAGLRSTAAGTPQSPGDRPPGGRPLRSDRMKEKLKPPPCFTFNPHCEHREDSTHLLPGTCGAAPAGHGTDPGGREPPDPGHNLQAGLRTQTTFWSFKLSSNSNVLNKRCAHDPSSEW